GREGPDPARDEHGAGRVLLPLRHDREARLAVLQIALQIHHLLPQMDGLLELEGLLGHSLHEVLGEHFRETGHVEDVLLGVERRELAAHLVEVVDQTAGSAAHSRVKRAEQPGRAGAFYAGMRGASCRLIDNLDQVGGQLTALYPEKYIFDVAGFPKVLAKDLVKGMAEQAFQFHAPVQLGEKVVGLRRESDNGRPRFAVVTDMDEYPSHTIIIAGGIGAFTPRKLPLKDVDRWYGKGLYDRILDPRVFAGKRVLLVGGGDSAFDW